MAGDRSRSERAARKADGALSRRGLLKEVRRLRAQVENEARLEGVIHELQVYQEEIQAQQAQLIESQRALEASRDRFADLFDFAPIGYVTLDGHGVIEGVNLAAARLIGVERARVVGLPFLLYVADGHRDRFLTHMSRCRDGRRSMDTEIVVKTRRGPSAPAQLSSRRVTDAEGHVSFLTAVIDLTERVRAEAERFRAEQERQRSAREEQAVRASSEAKDRFLATLSHELRTPLTPILFALATLEGGMPDPAAMRVTLEVIRRNVQHEGRLIDDLLDLTRIARDKVHLRPECVDLHAVLSDVVTMCMDEVRAARLELSLALEAQRHHVRGDPTRLTQIFWNLVKNAIRYTPAGGSVTMRTSDAQATAMRVVVQDTGVGIAPDMVGRIFSPFEQAEERGKGRAGLGLGLAICKGLVEAHGGRIGVTSPGPGRGATFCVELAVEAGPADVLLPVQQPTVRRTAPLAILLVEDDPDCAAAMQENLRLNGYQVRVVRTVRDALQLDSGKVDLVISDIGLPDGTGFDVMRQLRTRGPMHGIALSGYGSEEDVRESCAAGFARHLVKPIDPEVLVREIEKLVHS